ncbi:hypothetical protein MLD38_009152 [Melastoma candidum]|uniref:Uncharacterized protein n=1 Tax=Melastoma candidum TaxID=119954 RepID=A0ACB9RVR8_9MYRT|nr:hypothetical protein MLD38_009152 [Melastoma candidum]
MPPFPSPPSSSAFNADSSILLLLLLLSFTFLISHHSTPTSASLLSEPVQPNGNASAASGYGNDSSTVPSFPLQPAPGQLCKLDLSSELFGGVTLACTPVLDRDRCCPVLAAWLFAAHARYALQPPPSAPSAEQSSSPLVPDDSQKCVDALQDALAARKIHLPRPNETCDPVICYCGIRVHEISSLTCPAAFNVTAAEGGSNSKNSSGSITKTVKPTAAVRDLEKSCKNSSYAGCTRCLTALQKLKGNMTGGQGDRTGREGRMLERDCQLMGLTWLLARNKTSYIPTVSAALRAVMYSTHAPPTCSADRENMPLAVDSLQFDKAQASSSPCPLTSLAILFLGFFLHCCYDYCWFCW